MGEQVRRFGPVHGFWTFMFERLNKLLKGVEVGTLANVVVHAQREVQELIELEKSPVHGTAYNRRLDSTMQDKLLAWYHRQYPDQALFKATDAKALPGSLYLVLQATHYPQLRVGSYKLYATEVDRPNKSNALMQICFERRVQWVGELCDIFQHMQPGIGKCLTFALVDWLVPLQDLPSYADLYHPYPELEVDFWEPGQYLQDTEWAPPALILAEDICGVAARCTMEFEGRRMWITTGMSKDGKSL
ncbi:hypothetical protein DACRYDRAFT_24787 [Dacryopinax primogenitus]|uniref:Uncharacterized protein n=1 Tax=Dacryopinax primogenitus (strain DJM 731) TaxID=1858805 RepID=M5G236_DACPD|nr:uncharacterized protein DACRYDRAFT_24787 [Dacryopinax primogenitus]EJT97827.1 hypothetical protein DACRYDRAFT_24787 [Dacryopinax primogenitus]